MVRPPVISKFRGTTPTPLFRYLDKVGDGTGTKSATEDYSGVGLGSTDFKIAPAPGEVMRINRMIIAIVDSTGTNQDIYGNIGVLTNGLTVKIKDAGGDLIDLSDNIPIQTNGGWAHLCFDIFQPQPGVGNDHILVRWTFKRSGVGLRLSGNDGEFLAVTLNDDMTGLIEHLFHVQGHFE